MASQNRCTRCGKPLQVTAGVPGGRISCPGCGTALEVPESPSRPAIEIHASRPQHGGSRAAASARRRRRAPVATVALLASAALILGAGLAVATGWWPVRRAHEPASLAANSRDSMPRRTSPARAGTAAPRDRQHRARVTPGPADAGKSPVTQDLAGPAPSAPPADPLAASGPAGSVMSEAGPANPQPLQDPVKLVDALVSSERKVEYEEAGDEAESPGWNTEDDDAASPEETAERAELTPEERQRLAAVERLKKLIQRQFLRVRRTTDRTRGEAGDFFVVAKYDMPLATRLADLRFEVSEGVAPSVDQVADYLLTTPSSAVRDFQVVARFGARSEAETGVREVRARYDQAKAYQEQLLSFLQTQQRFRASAMRRC